MRENGRTSRKNGPARDVACIAPRSFVAMLLAESYRNSSEQELAPMHCARLQQQCAPCDGSSVQTYNHVTVYMYQDRERGESGVGAVWGRSGARCTGQLALHTHTYIHLVHTPTSILYTHLHPSCATPTHLHIHMSHYMLTRRREVRRCSACGGLRLRRGGVRGTQQLVWTWLSKCLGHVSERLCGHWACLPNRTFRCEWA